MDIKIVNKHIVVVLKTLNQDIPVSKKQLEKKQAARLANRPQYKYQEEILLSVSISSERL